MLFDFFVTSWRLFHIMEPDIDSNRNGKFFLNTQHIFNGQRQSFSNVQRTSLLMHPSTLKTLQFFKGCLVFLNSEKEQLLFRCWPCISIQPGCILLPSLNLFRCNLEGVVNVDCYNLLIDFADGITLSCDNYKYFMGSKAFKKFLQFKLDHFYLKEDLILTLIYLGYPCRFTVQKIESFSSLPSNEAVNQSDLDDIVKNISSLDITADNSILEDPAERSFLCSTPISSKCSVNTKEVQSVKFDNASKNFGGKSKLFYFAHLKTSIKIEHSDIDNTFANQIIFKDIGGLKECISKMKSLVISLLSEDKKESSGIILIGASGTGKSMMVQAAGNEFHLPVFNFDSFTFSRDKADFKYHLEKVIKEAIDNSPSMLLLDNIDSFSVNNVSNLQEDSIMHYFSSKICNILSSEKDVILIGAAQNISNVHALLRKSGALEKEIVLGIPSTDDRKEIFSKLLDKKHHNLSYKEITEMSDMTHGFTGGDLKLLCDKAIIASYQKTEKASTCISFEDLKEVLKDVKPSSVAEFQLEVPNVKWSDIGGMEKVKDAITEMVDWPLKHAEQFRRLKITPARGILMYGPPGCSKTMIAKALVSESHLNFISIKGPQIFNKYVGESEKSVSDLFKKARSAAPCVLFFDEIDSLASIRGSTSGNSKVAERILTQLLIEIDGIDVLQGVSIIAATNRPDMIDPSFLRPGRFDQMIYVPLPDAATRKEIFSVKLKNMPIDSEVDITYLVETTEGYTGAEITDVCREAAMSVIKDYITSSTATVSKIHFRTALQSVQPRTSKEMIEFYENYSKQS